MVWIPLGYSRLTNLDTAKDLSQGDLGVIPAVAQIAIIQSEEQAVRWRDDGTAPTATVGLLLAAGAWIVYYGDLKRIQFIEQAAGAIVHVSFYRLG